MPCLLILRVCSGLLLHPVRNLKTHLEGREEGFGTRKSEAFGSSFRRGGFRN